MTVFRMLVEEDPHRSRVAVLEDERLAEVFIERRTERGEVGSVFKGRVHRVLPGMQAAFVDIGRERDAFLYVGEVRDDSLSTDELDGDGTVDLAADQAAAQAHTASIADLLRSGQEIVVQILKDPMPNKGARVTTHVTLPGRYLVFLPGNGHFGVSRRIEDAEERQRLRDLVAELAEPGEGLIVRTAGAGQSREAFVADLRYLRELWTRIREKGAQAGAPTLLHRDLDLPMRAVRDLMSEDFAALWVDGENAYLRIAELLDGMAPALRGKVRLNEEDQPLFERFGVEDQIAEALRDKVWLKSGGHIVINPTEALVAIDVNTGRFVGGDSLDETIRATNLEAIQEIVRQVRLRNLGGIIVVDLIDMEDPAHRKEVFDAFEQELGRDRARNRILAISEFGLVQMTRKRTRPSLQSMLTEPCPHCRGRGRIRSLTEVCLDLRREVLRLARLGAGRGWKVRLHPDVAQALEREERAVLEELREVAGPILLEPSPDLHHERFEVRES